MKYHLKGRIYWRVSVTRVKVDPWCLCFPKSWVAVVSMDLSALNPLDSMELSWKPFLVQSSSVQLLSCVRLFATPWTAAHQTSLSLSWSLLKLMSIDFIHNIVPTSPLSISRTLSYKTQTLHPFSSPSAASNHHSTFFLIWLARPQIGGIIQYLSFCDWLTSLSLTSSRFMHAVATVTIPFSFKAKYSIACMYHMLLLIHPSMETWIGYNYFFVISCILLCAF